jgi:hypothetical protein
VRPLLAAVLCSLAVAAAAAEPPRFESHLVLAVGEVRIVTGGPVRQVICDDPKVVEIASTPAGNGFRGLSPGETTCSLGTIEGVRRTYRITVRAPEPERKP